MAAGRWGFRAVAAGLTAALALGGYWAFRGVPQQQLNRENRDRLKAVGLALHNYHDEFKSLPPAYVLGKDGKPWHSWRVLLLPQLGLKGLYDRYRFDEPWDGPNNRKLLAETPEPFRWAWPSAAGQTHFQVPVGSQTAWPGPNAMPFNAIRDGLSNTALVLETAAGIPWTAPNDVLFIKYAGDDPALRTPPAGRGGMWALWGDGSVRTIGANCDRQLIHAFLTIRSGESFGGKPLPEEKAAFIVEAQAVPRVALRLTDVWPVRVWPLDSARNSVWCATTQLTWQRHDAVAAQTGVPCVELAGRTPLALALAKERFPEAALDPASYVAETGPVPVIDERFRAALAKRFPGKEIALTPIPPDGAEGTSYRSVAYLAKALPFETPFGRQSQPIGFRHAVGVAEVEGFGCLPNGSAEAVRKQARVWAHDGNQEFVLSLATNSPRKDRVWLAALPAGKTLKETWAAVQQRIATPLKEHFAELCEEDTLLVPSLAFEADRTYPELVLPLAQALANRKTRRFAEVKQTIRFALDYKGASLESFSELFETPAANGHSPMPEPRKFAFDRPFLLALQEQDAAEPYFLAWIATPELLVPAKPSP